MKLKMLGMLTGLALLLPSASALAHADVRVDLGLGFVPPPAVVIEAEPAYYYDYGPRAYYRTYYGWYPRPYYAPRYRAYDHWRDDRRWHEQRGHRRHGRD